MTTDANNPAEPELAQADATSADTEQPETDQSDGDGGDLDTQGADPEFEEVDVEGERLAVPKSAAEKLRAAMLRQADYTRKTQELADLRKQSEAEIASEKARVESERANIQAVARLVALDEQLQAYAKVDWDAAYDSDPVGAGKAKAKFDSLMMQRQHHVAQVQQHEAQRALQEREATARAMQQANEVLGREIKGWSPDYAKSLRDVAKSLGADDRAIDSIREPWIVRALHAQKLLAEMTARAQKAPAPPPAQPVKTVTGGTSRAGVDPDKMSTDEWMAWRNKQVAKQRR